MGRNQEGVSIGHQKKNERHKHRHNDRQTGNLRQHERIFIFRDSTGPRCQRIGFSLAMMARVTVSSAMEMKVSSVWLVRRVGAGHAHIPGEEMYGDEQAGDQANQARGLAGSLTRAPGVQQAIHKIPTQKTWGTLCNRPENCLPTAAYECYR